jgi:hypothetical protein
VAAKIPDGQKERYQQQSQGQFAPGNRGGRVIGGLVGVSRGIFLFFDAWAPIFTGTIFSTPIFIATILFAAFFSLCICAARLLLIVAVIVTAGGKAGQNVVAGVGRADRGGFRGWGAEIRRNGVGRKLILARGLEIVRYGFFLVEADLAGVGADETFIEDAARELVKVFVFEGTQHAGADFCGLGDGVEIESALFALFAKFFSERSHSWLRRRG